MNQRRMYLAAACVLVTACGVDTSTNVSSTAAALEVAQCDFGSFDAAAAACRTTFEACIAVDGADVAACRTALHECLPPPPDRAGHMDGDGGSCRGHGDADGGMRGPPPGGGMGGPRGPRPDGDGGVRGPHQGRGPHPDPAAIQACREALNACVAADATDTTCETTESSCVRAAFDAAFQAACDEATVRCANDTSEPCTRILARCAAGVGGTNGTCAVEVADAG